VLRIALSLLFLVAPSAPTAPTPVCTVDNNRVGELSGLVVTDSGYIGIDDSNVDPAAIKIFYLTKACKLSRTVSYPTAARDPEDIAMAPDGTLWVADIGDNYNAAVRRETIALWKLAPGSSRPVIHRLTYPDGPHDAEALLLNGDGTPVIVTKELSGLALVFVPSAPLVASSASGVPLSNVGKIRLPESQTPNFLDSIGRQLATGGAVSPDGRHAVLRTYADAWEYDVHDGDVVAALLNGEPRQTPLPSEPQGEAIAYTPDGLSFVTASDQPFGPTTLLRYTPAARPLPSASVAPSASVVPSAVSSSSVPRRALVAIGIAGLVVVAVGIAGALVRKAFR
jgi:hypothetical protein